MDLLKRLEQEFSLKEFQVKNTVELLDAGNTVPFIARYRKEATGSLDDQLLRELSDRLTYLRGLQKRKEEVLRSIEEQEKLTPELQRALENAATLAEVEDLYRPYRPRRRTRGSIAREKGLEPLAAAILKQERNADPLALAAGYVSEEKQVLTPEEALAGARDILAEDFSDDAALRKGLRAYLFRTGQIVSKAPEPKADSVYAQYDDFSQPVNRIAGHRVLALNRGEREEYLKVTLQADVSGALGIMEKAFCKGDSSSASQTLCTRQVQEACDDSYKRLIFPSLETEIRSTLTERASEDAIKVFSLNLRQLLHAAAGQGQRYSGAGSRPTAPAARLRWWTTPARCWIRRWCIPLRLRTKVAEAKRTLTALILRHHVDHHRHRQRNRLPGERKLCGRSAQGASASGVLHGGQSEAGASVYSASKLAAEEFPEYDVSLRSAVSIARRLQDPLAELVKIDPKAIGVGQYQHDMPQKRLGEALDGVVEACVNAVGVDVNTASVLFAVPRGGHQAAAWPKTSWPTGRKTARFTDRKGLLKVPKLGPKAFEQCAGFLRVPGADNPLGRHGGAPRKLRGGGEAADLMRLHPGRMWPTGTSGRASPKGRSSWELRPAVPSRLGVGEPTLRDMIGELVRPGRDPRDELPAAPSAHRCAGDQGSEEGHGAQRHGAQRHRLWGVCGHRRASGRAGAHLPDRGPVHQTPAGSGAGGRCGHRLGAGRGLKNEAGSALTMKQPKEQAGQ